MSAKKFSPVLSPLDTLSGGHKQSTAAIVFEKYDTDKSGTIERKEFTKLCYEMGYHLTPQQVGAAMLLLDKDSNGVISFEEFNAWWQEGDKRWRVNLDEKSLEALKMAVKHFEYFDKDQEGTISKEEFEAMYENLRQNNVVKLEKIDSFNKMDVNNDGRISLNEYIDWLHKLGSF